MRRIHQPDDAMIDVAGQVGGEMRRVKARAELGDFRNRGEIRRYSGTTGKLSAAMAFLRGTASAVPMIPRMLRKRRAFRPKHRLTPRQIRSLLLRHRISLKEISESGT